MFKWIMIAVFIVGIAGFGFLVVTKKSPPLPGQAIPIVSRNHVPEGTKITGYNSNPPTSGDHYPTPANWGVYGEELPDGRVLHNLEHGGVWISYNCNYKEVKTSGNVSTPSAKAVNDSADCKDLIGKLEGITKGYKAKVIMTPRRSDDSLIAVASWGRLLKLNSFDGNQIADFVSQLRNRGPEVVPD